MNVDYKPIEISKTSSINQSDNNINCEDPLIKIEYWKQILIRSEFLYLYFQHLGLSENLNINRITEINEVKRKKDKETFQFAIIKTKKGVAFLEEDFGLDSNSIRLIKENNFIISYYKDQSMTNSKYVESMNFLSLAYSALVNLYLTDKKQKIFNEKKNPINNFFNFIKNQVETNNMDILDFQKNQSQLENFNELAKEHNKFIDDLCKNELDHICEGEEISDDESFSLFMLKNYKLYEFDCLSGKLSVIGEDVSNSTVREVLAEHMITINESQNKKIEYLGDITVFSEISEIPLEEEYTSKTSGLTFMFIIAVLFTINFYVVNNEATFYSLQQSFIDEFETTKFGENSLKNVTNMQQLSNYIISVVDLVYNKEKDDFDYSSDYFKQQDKPVAKKNIELNPKEYYIKNTNYVSGMMMNYRTKNMTETSDEISITVSEMNYYGAEAIAGPGILDENEALTNDNPLYPESFKMYFKPSLSYNQVEWYRNQIFIIFKEPLAKFAFTIIFYNPNFNCAVMYSLNFDIDSFNRISYVRYFQGFSPFLFDNPNTFILLLIINIIYMIFFLYVTFIVAKNFVQGICDLIKSYSFNLEWYDWLDAILLGFSFTSQLICYRLFFFRSETFPIAIPSDEDFLFWVDQINTMRIYLRITGFTIFLIMVRLMRVIYSRLPAIGIVFQTLEVAHKEIFSFTLILAMILSVVTFTAHICFGWYSSFFANLSTSFTTVFLLFMGVYLDDQYINSQHYNKIAPFFLIFFLAFLNLISIQVFLCILRHSYSYIKEKHSKMNKAMSLILKDKTNVFKHRVYNFLCCIDPYSQIDSEIVEINGQQANNRKRSDSDSLSLWQILKYNLNRLELKSIFKKSKMQLEEFNLKKKDKYKEIYKKEILMSISEIKSNYDDQFSYFSQFVLYIIYIIIFVSIIFLQMKFSYSEFGEIYLKNYFNKTFIKYPEIDKFEQIYNNTMDFLNKSYVGDDHCQNFTFREKLFDFYSFSSPPYLRLTFRLIKKSTNTRKYDYLYFPLLILDTNSLDSSNCNSISEETTNIIIPFTPNFSNQTEFGYKMIYSSDTPDSCAGYVYLVGKENPLCTQNLDDDFRSAFLAYSEIGIGSLTIDTIVFPSEYPYIIYVKTSFVKNSFGKISHDLVVFSIPINTYNNGSDFFRLFLEISFIFLTVYYLIIELNEIYEELKIILKNDFENSKSQTDFSESGTFNKFFRYEFNNLENMSLFSFLKYIVWTFIRKVLIFIMYVIFSFIRYTLKDLFNIADFISLCISVYLVSLWIQICAQTNLLSIASSNTSSNISLSSQLYHKYNRYLFLLSINSFKIVLRFLQYFKFSKALNSLLSIITRNKSSIINHLLFIVIMNLGLGYLGYAIFSHNFEFYSTLSKVVLQQILTISGDLDFWSLTKIDSKWGLSYFVLYFLLNSLVLLNILVAIVVEGYREMKLRQEQNIFELKSMNFFENLYNIVKNKYKLFTDRCILYFYNLESLKMFMLHDSDARMKKSKENIDKELINLKAGFFTAYKSHLVLMKQYHKIVKKKIIQYESKTCDAIYFTEIKESSDDFFSNYYEIRFKEIVKKTQNVSIWMKIAIYLNSLIDDNFFPKKCDEDYAKKNSDEAKFNNVRTTLNFNRAKNNIGHKKNRDANVKFRFKFNEWIVQFRNGFDSIYKSKNLHFYKEGFFLHKFFLYDKSYFENIQESSLYQLYEVEEINYKNKYNVNFDMKCDNYPQCVNKNTNCQCLYIKSYYESISVLVYDVLIKYFILSPINNLQDREIILAYYFCLLKKKLKENFVPEKFNEIFFKERIKMFEHDINQIINHIHFSKLKISDLYVETKVTNNIMNISERESSLNMIKNLYKFFTIWNTLLIILHKKDLNYVSKLQQQSESYKVKKEAIRQKKDYQRVIFEYSNNILRDLNPEEIKEEQENSTYSDHILKTYRNFIQHNSEYEFQSWKDKNIKEDIDFKQEFRKILKENAFYEDPEKYMLDIDYNSINQTLLPKENNWSELSPYTESSIIIKMWESLHQSEKFFLFFGYNKYIIDEIKIDNFLANNFLNENSMKYQINFIMLSPHRAELLTMLKFPKFFENLLILKLKEFAEDNKMLGNNKAYPQTGREVLEYFHNERVNIKVFYEFMSNIFEMVLRKIKHSVKKTTKEFKYNFKLIVRHFKQNFEISSHQSITKFLEFIKFYKLYFSRAQFDRILSTLDSSKEIFEFETIDDASKKAFLKYENFVLAASLGPIELLNAIMFIEDKYFKEFYLMFFTYLHHEDEDFLYFMKYLRKSIRHTVYYKYKDYATYLNKRHEQLILEDQLKTERFYNEASTKYLSDLKEKIKNLTEIKNNLLEKLTLKLDLD